MDSAPEAGFVLAMKKFKFVILILVLLFDGLAAALAQDRTGKVEFSNSNVLSGVISQTPGTELKIYAGKSVRVLTLDRVQEILFTPEKEKMERAFRFKAGQTAPEYFGDSYPVRTLAATITLGGGEKISGHLAATVLYVTDGDNTQKVILLASQRGQENQTFQQLVYPRRISFGDTAAVTTATIKLKLTGLDAKPEVVAITRGELTRLEVKPRGNSGEFEMPSALGEQFFLAVNNGQTMRVGWPKASDEKNVALIQGVLADSKDFLDTRKVLGVVADAEKSEIYSLVFSIRKGKTFKTEDEIWRLELYRWKQADDGRIMLAGREFFFRDTTKKIQPPPVELSEKLWNLHPSGDVWTDSE